MYETGVIEINVDSTYIKNTPHIMFRNENIRITKMPSFPLQYKFIEAINL